MISTFAILDEAFSNTPHSKIWYRKFVSKTVNDFGVVVQNFTDWKTVEAIVQPGIISSFGGKCVELKDYKDMGLDWSRRYVTVWLRSPKDDDGNYTVLEPAADRDGADQFKITEDGVPFNTLQVENWEQYTRYQRTYGVQLKPEDI